jgi:hypothetical protein
VEFVRSKGQEEGNGHTRSKAKLEPRKAEMSINKLMVATHVSLTIYDTGQVL